MRKTVTVLFCDVTGSTALGERQDPERLRRVMTRYFEVAQEILERHQGKVEKFIGDAVMAVFGVPVLHEDDALRALRAASDLKAALRDLNVDLERTHGVRIEVRTGVNSGEVIAGDPTRDNSFVSGDVVVVAERLQRSAAPGEILIGEETYRLARDAINAEPLEPLTVKGKRDRVMAYRLLEVVPGAPALARRFDSPMVGRTRELALLESAFSRACREESCHLFTVLGPAGVGKSRLVAEALAAIGDRGRVLSGSCLPYGEGITFWPVLEIVKQLTEIDDGDSPAEARAKIEAVLAGEPDAELVAARVAQLIGLAETGVAVEEGFWGVRHLFEAIAREHPLVIVFDDLNWAEPTLLDLVEHIADWSRDASILLVAMARPDLLDARPAWGGGKHNATAIFLEPLVRARVGAARRGPAGRRHGRPGGIRSHPGRRGGQPAVRRGDDLDAHRRRRTAPGERSLGGAGSRPARHPVQHLGAARVAARPARSHRAPGDRACRRRGDGLSPGRDRGSPGRSDPGAGRRMLSARCCGRSSSARSARHSRARTPFASGTS